MVPVLSVCVCVSHEKQNMSSEKTLVSVMGNFPNLQSFLDAVKMQTGVLKKKSPLFPD